MNYSIGIDLGGTNIKAVVVQPDGTVIIRKHLPFDPSIPMDWAHKSKALVQEIEREQNQAPNSIGVAAPGLASVDGRSIAHMPGRLEGLENLEWRKFLGFRRKVPVLNDAHAALLGEWWLGGARGFRNAILLTLGTGVGGAILADGKLWLGTINRAGHLGHVSVDPQGRPDIAKTPGSLEDEIGNWTVGRRSQGRFTTTRDLVAAHIGGDPEATGLWMKSIRSLAASIASFINILDPEAVIIGGGIAQAGSALFDPLRKFLDEMEWRPGGHQVNILPAELGEFAGAFGSARHALDRARRSPDPSSPLSPSTNTGPMLADLAPDKGHTAG